eukprot:1936827-Pyramimonas_sp.AAC.1
MRTSNPITHLSTFVTTKESLFRFCSFGPGGHMVSSARGGDAGRGRGGPSGAARKRLRRPQLLPRRRHERARVPRGPHGLAPQGL